MIYLFKADQVLACTLLNTLFNYFMVCTYFWMLCEGEQRLKGIVKQ